jgi:hypothetical protein
VVEHLLGVEEKKGSGDRGLFLHMKPVMESRSGIVQEVTSALQSRRAL